MKTIFVILALVAMTLAIPAEDNKKPERSGSVGETQYDGTLNFNYAGDSSLKGRIEALFKPIVDYLKLNGVNGDLLSEGSANGASSLTGVFRFSGNRKSKASSQSDATTTPQNVSGRLGRSSS